MRIDSSLEFILTVPSLPRVIFFFPLALSLSPQVIFQAEADNCPKWPPGVKSWYSTWGNCQPQLEKSLGVETNVCCKFTRASVKINSKDEAELFFFVSLKKIFFSFFICALWLVDLSSPNRD